jgi:hypothetical protein
LNTLGSYSSLYSLDREEEAVALVPSFILRKLYVPGSLTNTDMGCQFQIKNTLAPATVTGVGPVVIDGDDCPAKDVLVMRGSERAPVAEVSKARPVAFDINVVVTLVAKGRKLAPGEHHLSVEIASREAGRLKIEITDRIDA